MAFDVMWRDRHLMDGGGLVVQGEPRMVLDHPKEERNRPVSGPGTQRDKAFYEKRAQASPTLSFFAILHGGQLMPAHDGSGGLLLQSVGGADGLLIRARGSAWPSSTGSHPFFGRLSTERDAVRIGSVASGGNGVPCDRRLRSTRKLHPGPSPAPVPCRWGRQVG